MTEALLLVSTVFLLIFGVSTLVVAILALQYARRYVELAERRMEHLREGQTRLLLLLNSEQRQFSREESEREEQGQAVEALERERRARRDAERKIDHLERELVEARQEPGVQWESSLPVATGVLEHRPELRGVDTEAQVPARETHESPAWKTAEAPPQDQRPRLGVWRPHPDDGGDQGSTPSGPARTQSEGRDKMFRKHYEKYLDNYRGYVELAEGLYRMRDEGEVTPGSREARDWQDRLRRVNEGIQRTTARLDILERHNPELAADDRVSLRAGVARRHSELQKNAQNH